MVFSSHLFLFYFLPVALLLNYTLPFRYLSLLLVVLSYLFYGWSNPPWVLLMLASSSVDYFCGLGLVRFSGQPGVERGEVPRLLPGPRNAKQKALLAVSIGSNLAILGYFKYHDFALDSFARAAAALGLPAPAVTPLAFLLPVGISFYTFQSMSYAIDVYRGDARALKNPIDFQCFVANFPHLVAGPIVRYQTMDDQLRFRTFTYE
jgi:alginate O-acetyltransferase complex protein AlgI